MGKKYEEMRRRSLSPSPINLYPLRGVLKFYKYWTKTLAKRVIIKNNNNKKNMQTADRATRNLLITIQRTGFNKKFILFKRTIYTYIYIWRIEKKPIIQYSNFVFPQTINCVYCLFYKRSRKRFFLYIRRFDTNKYICTSKCLLLGSGVLWGRSCQIDFLLYRDAIVEFELHSNTDRL